MARKLLLASDLARHSNYEHPWFKTTHSTPDLRQTQIQSKDLENNMFGRFLELNKFALKKWV